MAKVILLIDDDRTIVKAVQVLLEQRGYSVITAFDGQQGINMLKSNKVDLIILDVVMPVMDGYSFVQEVKLVPGSRDIPIIILTGKDSLEEIFRMEGIKDYIVKPFKPTILLNKVQAYFEQSAAA